MAAVNERTMDASAEAIWDVLADGWLYPLWVVGASRMRDVDRHWPDVGSRLHHSVGVWPLLVDDETEVLDVIPGEALTLHARARPTGTAEVALRLEPRGAETRVVIEEDAVAGPGLLVPRPLRELGLTWRNVESLRRLAYLAERRARRSHEAS
ncbi:SRPBCC family protein [Nocardioides sp. LMS-CY]|uniref:SRPBCC family protein n=1 Tax=Nocardioides TaxID=1839 RepID=UPI00160BFE8D|nr:MULTISPECIES: SRPBCC family protein [Nocardioides]QWF20548.1 SRPBCC family protein [Nocardioides sp. LMS-CY]